MEKHYRITVSLEFPIRFNERITGTEKTISTYEVLSEEDKERVVNKYLSFGGYKVQVEEI